MILRERSNDVRESRNRIHTGAVTDIINQYSMNAIFGIHPYPLQLQMSAASVLLAQLRHS